MCQADTETDDGESSYMGTGSAVSSRRKADLCVVRIVVERPMHLFGTNKRKS